MKPLYVLDASALLAFIVDEPGADKVETLLDAAARDECIIVMNKINLLEAFYVTWRKLGHVEAQAMLQRTVSSPIVVLDQMSDVVLHEAGRYKVSHPLSLGDAILLAQAKTCQARIVTSDHHELNAVEAKEGLEFFWIR